MADISLRDYLAKLDSLLSGDSAPAVILHARHILQHYPRNAQTYRLLGRSLVATGRWPEAAEVMRRVLSVFPDDKEAHAGMSEVYRLEKRADDAIWHLERAFEQSPNDQTILDNLRDLYRKNRKVEHGKVQLTAGAVARQYIRNGLYEQALDTLQKAIAATPERVDLRLLLAQTYWDAGRRVEAGETALEVLKTLPDCLVANTLMAALWLTESRPSDAQRYINRMQSLDPYLALELAQGQDVPDDTFKLSELDYQKAAERELIAQTPEWLKGIDAATAASMSADLDSRTDADEIMAGEGLRRSRTSEPSLFEELGEPDTLFDEQTQPPPGGVAAARSGLTDRLAKPQTAERPVPGPKKGLTGRFAAVSDEPLKPEPMPSFMADLTPVQEPAQDELPNWLNAGDAATVDSSVQDELPDWMQASAETAAPAEADDLPFRRQRAAEPDHTDPLAWLRDSGIEVVEATGAADHDLFDTGDDHLALQDADAADPLSWMQSYGGKDMMVENTADSDETGLIDNALPGDDDNDPLAWLQQADVEPTTPASFSSATIPAADDSDPLAWLQQADIELTDPGESAMESSGSEPPNWLSDDTMLDEAFDLESLVDNRVAPSEPLASVPSVSPTTEMSEGHNVMPDEKDPLDWLSSAEPQPDSQTDETFTWADQSTTPEEAVVEGTLPDWLTSTADEPVAVDAANSDDGEDMDWMSNLPPNEAETTQPVKTGNTGMLEWLNKSAPQTSELPPTPTASDSVPDWLNDMQTEIEAEPSAPLVVDENGFEWMSQSDVMPSAVSADNNPPDWLSELNLADETAALADDVPLAAAEVPDWLTQSQMGDEQLVEAQTSSAENAPDWLGDLNMGNEAEAVPLEDSSAVSDAPEWLSEMAVEDAAPAAADDTPDWLADLKPVETVTPAVAEIITPDWLSEMNTPELEEPPEPDTVTQMPGQIQDWVATVRAQSEGTVLQDDTPDWLAAMQPEAAAEAEPEAMMTDTPDWLSAMKPEDEAQPMPEPQAGMTDTPDWLAELQPEGEMVQEASVAPIADDEPDWLAAMQPDDEAELEPQAIMSDAPDWLTDSQPVDEDEPQAAPVMTDEPDWLTAMRSEPNTMGEPEPEPVANITPDWMSDLQPEEPVAVAAEPEPMASDTPDWLTDMQADAIGEAQVETEASLSDTPDWLTDLQPEGEVEQEAAPVASDQPDWLTAMQSESSTMGEPEPEAVVSDTPEWLADLQPEEPPALEAEPLADATPDWLAAMQSAADVTTDLDDVVSEEPDWQADEPAPMTQRPVNSAVTRDLSDWTGGQNLDFDPTAPAADEPDWLTSMATDAVPEPAADDMMTADEVAAMDEVVAENATEMPDWLTAIRPAASGEVRSDYQWDDESGDGENMPAAPAPAQNAPDWLNAMVPGLDVDYEAEEDEPLETEFLPGSENRLTPVIAATPAKTRPEYSWLLDIVQEESQQIRAVGQQSMRRFIFSRLPAWLRKPTEMGDEAVEAADADNVDIPPWLQ